MKNPIKLLVLISIVFVVSIGAWFLVRTSKLTTNQTSTVVVALEGDVEGLDPASLRSPVASRVVWQIFEGLVGIEESGDAVPLLAESWESNDDCREWTFRVRAGVKYHPDASFGPQQTRFVTAEDVKYSYQRIAKGFGSFVLGGIIEGFDDFVQGKADHISGILVAGTDQVIFRLTKSEPSFIYRLTSPYLSIMPKEAVESHGTNWGASAAVGTGPFRLESARNGYYALSRFEHYWRQSSDAVNRLEFRVEKNPELLSVRLARGDYDIGLLPAIRVSQYIEKGQLRQPFSNSLRLNRFSTYNTTYLNFDVGRVPDVILRRWVAANIDKNVIARQLLQETGTVADSLVPEGMLGFKSSRLPEFDDEKAVTGSLTMLVPNQQDLPEIAQVIQAQLSIKGVKVTIETLGEDAFISRIFSEKRPDLFLVSSEWVFSAPEFILRAYDSRSIPNPNLTRYSNPEIDRSIDHLSSILERVLVNQTCREVETRALIDAPIIPLFNRDQLVLSNRRVNGLKINQHNQWDFTAINFND